MRKLNRTSIRTQLLGWLLLPLTVLWLASAAITFFMAESYADTVYDDHLLNSADSVIGRLRLKSSGLDVDLPTAAIAVLRHNFKDKFYFQVISQDGKLIDGDAVLPIPNQMVPQQEPVFGHSKVSGERVRTVLIDAEVEETPGKRVFVYVAETLQSRKNLADQILMNTILSQLLVILIGALAVSFGVTRGLKRLELLRKELALRSQSDLSPLNLDEAPLEVLPLLQSINDLLGLLREDLSAKKRFVANAAHQLRTPLAGLKTYIGLLKKMSIKDEAAEVLNQLDAGADRTTHLVNRLLALAKAEPDAGTQSNYQIIDLNSVASASAANLVPEAVKKNIDLSFEASGEPALILGDEGALQELITNIVENAVRYTPDNGIVQVFVSNGPVVELTVEDNGPGIPPHERTRVFERFYRILGTGISGSGLGLSIVNEIARSHNARVLIESGTIGTGTRVQVEFIRAQAGEAGAGLSQKQSEPKQLDRARVKAEND